MQTVGNETLLDDPDKVKVKGGIHDGKDDLFAAIPDLVEVDKGVVDLEPGGHPDAKDADVDGQEDEEAEPLEPRPVGADDHEKADSVDDDLNEALHLC